MTILQHLPNEIIHLILEFHGYHVFRNGKYMRQLDKHRYIPLQTLPIVQPTLYDEWEYEVSYTRRFIYRDDYKYKIYTRVYDDRVVWTMEYNTVLSSQNCYRDYAYIAQESYYKYFIRFTTHKWRRPRSPDLSVSDAPCTEPCHIHTLGGYQKIYEEDIRRKHASPIPHRSDT